MHVKYQICCTSIGIFHSAQGRSGAIRDEATHGCVAGAWKQYHLRCCTCIADRGNRLLDAGCPFCDVKVVRLWRYEMLKAWLALNFRSCVLTSFITPKMTLDADAYFAALE